MSPQEASALLTDSRDSVSVSSVSGATVVTFNISSVSHPGHLDEVCRVYVEHDGRFTIGMAVCPSNARTFSSMVAAYNRASAFIESAGLTP